MKIDGYENLDWHLSNNVMPTLTPKAIENILKDCKRFQDGEITLDHIIGNDDKGPCTFGEMCDDLKIPLYDEDDLFD